VGMSPSFSVAGSVLECVAERDFDRLQTLLAPDIAARALLPRGPREWSSSEEVADAFRTWFGSAVSFDLVDAIVGEVGPRLHLRWRLRVRRADDPTIGYVLEQQVYADTGPDGRVTRLDLLCSGFCPAD